MNSRSTDGSVGFSDRGTRTDVVMLFHDRPTKFESTCFEIRLTLGVERVRKPGDPKGREDLPERMRTMRAEESSHISRPRRRVSPAFKKKNRSQGAVCARNKDANQEPISHRGSRSQRVWSTPEMSRFPEPAKKFVPIRFRTLLSGK